MEKIIDSPFTEGKAVLHKRIKKMEFRKEEFEVYDFYYKCEVTGKEFSTTETGDLVMKQLFNQYREKNDILFPEQISDLRERYGLSPLKMSAVLGFGPNMYKNYEKGDIPSKSNSNLMDDARSPQIFYDRAVKSKQLSDKELEKLKTITVKLISKEFILENYPRINSDEINQFTGYVKRNFEKFANMVLYFLRDDRTFTTRLNKYLFYADFKYYSQTGHSMSGYPYCAIDNGPFPDSYKLLFAKMWEKGFIENKEMTMGDKTVEQFVPAKSFDKKLFNQSELNIMNAVYNTLRYEKTDSIIDLSHQEKGWIENQKSASGISYQKYAFGMVFNDLLNDS